MEHSMEQSPEIGEPKRRLSTFSDAQRGVLIKYFDERGMTSTKRRNMDLMMQCANDVGTTIEKVKNWIGSEAVKRKRKAGLLPKPKVEFVSFCWKASNEVYRGCTNYILGTTELKALHSPAAKKMKRVNGYNVFFSEYTQTHPELGPDLKERNATVSQKWAELSDEEQKQWGVKAEAVCRQSLQQSPTVSNTEYLSLSPGNHGNSLTNNNNNSDENIVEKTLLAIQEKFEFLEQLGFEGYSILVNTGALQTHLLATSKGKSFHKQRHQIGKPLENPFIGYVFTESADVALPVAMTTTVSTSSLMTPSQNSPVKIQRVSSVATPLSSLDTMQRSVADSFALKFKLNTGRSEIPYDNIDATGFQVYGMPPGVPFHSPLLYNQHQCQQILANCHKIAFIPKDDVLEVEIPSSHDAVSSLVDSSLDLTHPT